MSSEKQIYFYQGTASSLVNQLKNKHRSSIIGDLTYPNDNIVHGSTSTGTDLYHVVSAVSHHINNGIKVYCDETFKDLEATGTLITTNGIKEKGGPTLTIGKENINGMTATSLRGMLNELRSNQVLETLDSTLGFITQTDSSGSILKRTIVQDSGITITNGNGISGNPTILNSDRGSIAVANSRGVVNGVASLDSSGKVPVSQLPSYVDDVLEYPNVAAFPVVGEAGKIYVVTSGVDINKQYRWSGTLYVKLSTGSQTLSQVLLTGNDGGGLGMTNTGHIDSGSLSSTVSTGNWQVSAPVTTASGFVVTQTVGSSVSGTYAEQVGVLHGGEKTYKSGSNYICKEGFYWIICTNINDAWNTSLFFGAGSLPTPVGFYQPYNGQTGNASVNVSGETRVDSIVAEGNIYSDSTIKARLAFNVAGKLLVLEDRISMADGAKELTFHPDGTASLEGIDLNQVTFYDDILVKGCADFPWYNASTLRGIGVDETSPTLNQVLAYNGTGWIPTTLPSSIPTNHASSSTTYGMGSSMMYGHVKSSTSTPLMDSSSSVGTDDGTYSRGDHVHPIDTSRASTAHTNVTGSSIGQATATLFGHSKATSTNPVMNGTVSVGTDNGLYSRGDHVHPSDITKQATLVSGTNIRTINGSTLLGSTDLVISTGVSLSSTNPLMNGSVSAGVGTTASRTDHVHPSDTAKQSTLVSGTNIRTVNGSTLLGSTDLVIPVGSSVGSSTPLMNGTANYGSLSTSSREDHVHPSDTSRVSRSDFLLGNNGSTPVTQVITSPRLTSANILELNSGATNAATSGTITIGYNSQVLVVRLNSWGLGSVPQVTWEVPSTVSYLSNWKLVSYMKGGFLGIGLMYYYSVDAGTSCTIKIESASGVNPIVDVPVSGVTSLIKYDQTNYGVVIKKDLTGSTILSGTGTIPSGDYNINGFRSIDITGVTGSNLGDFVIVSPSDSTIDYMSSTLPSFNPIWYGKVKSTGTVTIYVKVTAYTSSVAVTSWNFRIIK